VTVILPDTSKLKDYEYPKIAERFYRDTAHHELTILHDDGLYRHIRMMPNRTRSSAYWYEIITWPGNLVFRGDGETFAFSRTEDMFEFFRSGLYKDGSVHINPGYWAEKLTSNRECVKTYDEEKFKKYTAEILAEAERDYPGLTEAWKKATSGFTAEYNTEHEQGAWEALSHFEYGRSYTARCSCGKASVEMEYEYDAKSWARTNGHLDKSGLPVVGHEVKIVRRDPFTFELSDLGDFFKDYNWWFLWALYGIVEAIKAYDDPKSPRRLVKNSAVENVLIDNASKPL
jgi:hypothetical protein